MATRYSIRVRILPDGAPMTIVGRDAWALEELKKAGKRGITSYENPAPRLGHYIFKLRGFGFSVETIHEPHGGKFSGTHARYVLRSEVEILPGEKSREAA